MHHPLKRFFYALLLIGAGCLGAMPGYAAPLSGIGKIAAGGDHTCALTTAGGVKCWGNNVVGQLGDNSTTQRLTPVDVVGLASGVSAIAVGGYHTCALTTAGGVKCWGGNYDGQLGDNSTTNRLMPADVTGLTSGVAAIALGINFTCALTTAGGMKCWGTNYFGQLGDNSTTQRLTPVDVTGLASGVTDIATGGRHTCALTTAGGVKCWGLNISGELGDNSTTQRFVPVDVKGLASGVTAIATGVEHTCALATAGGVKCWGWNYYGQLGDNSIWTRLTPVDVTDLASGVTAIDTGTSHTCALTTAGGVKCWGPNGYGQLGDNSVEFRLIPVGVTGLASGVVAIAAGFDHTCALTTAGGVKCWGGNYNGQIGDNSITNRLTPVDVILTPSVCYTAPSATGSGSVSACFTGGGPSCAYAAPQFIGAPPGVAPIPPTTPGPGIVFPHGLFDFSTSGCLTGNTLSFSITYPAALPPGTQYWKYGPTAANTTPHWYVLPATISGNTATFSITDGGLGDDDLVANGTIVDQGGPGAGSSSNSVPTLSEWAMGLLVLLMLLTVAARRYGARGEVRRVG